jgi:hypothetical protein
MAGMALAAAAALFWLSWLLMPGVGVTDPERIFALVASRRALVLASVVVQLVSAALYVPALLGLSADRELGAARGVRAGATLLLLGAMGSAADAVLHLLAYAMTAPDLDLATLVRVMAFMQGPGLLLLAPLILCFFAGGATLSRALARAGVVPRAKLHLHGAALATALAGGALARLSVLPPRAVGLAVLALVSGAQAWLGLALWRRAGAQRGSPSSA